MRTLIALPFLLLLVLFALSNTQAATFALWPTDFSIAAPVSVAVLVGMAAAFIVGGLMVWFSAVGQRHRARRAEAAVRRLEAQLQEARARLPSPVLPPPGG